MADAEDDSSWVTDLETALVEECDFGTLKNICKCRPVPDHLRFEVWQRKTKEIRDLAQWKVPNANGMCFKPFTEICLSVQNKGNSMGSFDELFDMEEQGQVRKDCRALVDKLGNEEEDKVSIISDLESIITFFSKSRNERYTSDSGWLDILQPLLALKQGRSEIYNCFYSLVNKYIPRECCKNGKPFHLFRLLLQYHDPELCSFLDTKKITPDTYAQTWFRSLFAAVCDLQVIKYMWDVYFQHGDPFLVFFMALVILVNAREQVLAGELESRQSLIEMLTSFPSGLEAEDIEDFCSLAQYYACKTPQSFRRDYQSPLFGTSMVPVKEEFGVMVSQALCLPVSVMELLQANKSSTTNTESVRYFVVDCRPAEQYNRGHLPTAFHLDADLMLQNPMEFNTAVQALLATQQHVTLSGAASGGEHLCFIGSGREEEDQYVHMVVANFLQKHHHYVSIARGGYGALHRILQENLVEGLSEEYTRLKDVCNPDNSGSASDLDNGDEFCASSQRENGDSLFGKLSSVVKSKSAEMKQKLTDYIKNEHQLPERHVSNTDRVGKRYRNMANVFSIGDDDDAEEMQASSSDDERKETVSLETWLKKPDIAYSCKCQEIVSNGYMYPSYILVTDSHLFVLREIPNRKGMAHIQARRALGSIVKITSKKRHPELITFKYGCTEDDNSITVSDLERFVIPKAGEATKMIKQQILKVLDALER